MEHAIAGGLKAIIPNLQVVEEENEPTSVGSSPLTTAERMRRLSLGRLPDTDIRKIEFLKTLPEGCTCFGTGGDPQWVGVTYGFKDGQQVEHRPGWAGVCEACDQGRDSYRRAVAERDEQLARQREARLERIFDKAGIPNRYYDASLTAEPRSDAQRAAMAQLAEWVKESAPTSVWLWGEVGTGKTWLACATVNDWITAHTRTVLFTTVGGLLLKIRSTFNRKRGEEEETEEEVLSSVRTVSLLLLDDVGRGGHTDWAHETLWELINSRYLDERPLIITSNKKPSEIAGDLGEATLSRILEECLVIHVGGSDLRTERAA